MPPRSALNWPLSWRHFQWNNIGSTALQQKLQPLSLKNQPTKPPYHGKSDIHKTNISFIHLNLMKIIKPELDTLKLCLKQNAWKSRNPKIPWYPQETGLQSVMSGICHLVLQNTPDCIAFPRCGERATRSKRSVCVCICVSLHRHATSAVC